MHERIARLPGSDAALDGRTSGISGLVYKTIRGVTRVGGSIEALLGLIAPALGHYAEAAERDAPCRRSTACWATTGNSGNPLALPMELQRRRALVLEREALAQPLPDAGPRLLVLVHGLCMNDRQWLRNGHDRRRGAGARSGLDAGLPSLQQRPARLHQRPCAGGAARAAAGGWPTMRCSVAIVGHSMGGLVARSAVHAAERPAWPGWSGSATWSSSARRTTARPLERAGHWVDLVLGATPYAAPFARLGRAQRRHHRPSRHGHVLDEDWVGCDRFARSGDRRQPLPLPARRALLRAGREPGRRAARSSGLLGDGLKVAAGQRTRPPRHPARARWPSRPIDNGSFTA